MDNVINVKSEIGTLKKVLLHRPGNELLNLTPDTLSRLLFDDIPFLPEAQKEHDEFAHILKENGIEVVYLEDLMAEVLELGDDIENKFIRQFIFEAGIRTPKYKELVFDYLKSFVNKKELVLKTMEGIKIEEIPRKKREVEKSLVDLVSDESEFLADPMQDAYLQFQCPSPQALSLLNPHDPPHLKYLIRLHAKQSFRLFLLEEF